MDLNYDAVFGEIIQLSVERRLQPFDFALWDLCKKGTDIINII